MNPGLKTCFWMVLGLLLAAGLTAQEKKPGMQHRWVDLQSDTMRLDSLSIIFDSFTLRDKNGQTIDASNYELIALSGELITTPEFRNNYPRVQVHYRTFPFSFYEEYYHKNPDVINPEINTTQNPFRYTGKDAQKQDVFELGGLEKTGSISRGIGFGNNRDLSVSSSLNLQLSGKISENLYVLAAITDENVPIQPDGNTQQLQDFDQVFIQVYNDRSKLIAGDFKLDPPKSYFMRYLKKAQGLTGETKFYVGKARPDTLNRGKMKVKLSGALSRGKFARNIIQGVEGNQGPYRLNGNENESFIIILSGTERVFIDGRQLIRGQDQDYIINYNTAEITFTAKQIITKDKRIVVEFQYSDQNYTRSLVQFSDRYQYKNLTVDFNLYSEQDAKNQSLQQDLSDEQEQILAQVGDSLHNAWSWSPKAVEFNENEILYKMVDTISSDSIQYDSVLVYSTNPDSAFYRVTFTEVSPGQGNYAQVNSVANGRVFQWVNPVGGIPQGTHAPITVLYAPAQKQMATLGTTWKYKKKASLVAEAAVSKNDINTFSELDSDNDVGYAAKVDWKHGVALSEDPKGWALIPQLRMEHWSKNFSEIERIRTVEFYRDWNLRDVNLVAEQNIAQAGLSVQKNPTQRVEVNWQGFFAESQYEANKANLLATYKTPGIYLDFKGSYLSTEGSLSKSEFTRHKTLLKKKLFFFWLGYRDDREDNHRFDPETDTLRSDAYRFWEREVFLEAGDSNIFGYRIFYNQREDDQAAENQINPATFGESFGASIHWRKMRQLQIAARTTYRKLDIRNETLTTYEPDENLLSRLEYNLNLFKGAVTAGSFYEVGSGLEAKREIRYIKVASGQGVYTWIDYNENGIEELNEFEVAAFQDEADYIRIFNVTDEYVKTFTNQFNQTLYINPARIWRNKKGIRKFLAAFANQTAYRIDRKTESEDLDARFNPLPNAGIDSSLVGLNSSLRNTVYFNRTHQIYGLDWTYQDIRGRTLLTNGLESRATIFNKIRARVNITRLYLLELEGTQGDQFSEAEYSDSRDYSLDYYSFEPKLTYQPGISFRMAVKYRYEFKENEPSLGGETGEINEMGLEMRFNKVGKGSFLMEVNYLRITYEGENNNSLAYEMLEGLQVGNNATWQLSYQRNIGKYLQLDLSYGGRQSEDTQTIHTGTMRVRAYF